MRTVWRIAKEPAVTSGDDRAARRTRRLGRPPVADTVTEQLRTWLTAEPDLPPGEVHRRLEEAGHALGLSTVYRLLGATRPTLPASVQVRFEGVAGEFAQFDFGHVEVRLVDGARRRIHFAAYRLKWSRWMFVTVVANERAEALIRSLLAAFAASGGVPLRVVFDNPKTVVLRREAGRPVWHPTLAQAVLDYGTSIELCTPHQPQQKGSVENLVGFVKRAFFRARRFQDLDTDLPQQLTQWLTEVNTVRPSRATGVPPAVRLAEEQARLSALAIAPADYGLHVPVTVGPTAMVTYQGVRYAMPAKACGLPATLHLYPDGAARRAARVGLRQSQAAVLHARAAGGARPRRRGLRHGAGASAPAYVAGVHRAGLRRARAARGGRVSAAPSAGAHAAPLRRGVPRAPRRRARARHAAGGRVMSRAPRVSATTPPVVPPTDLDAMLKRLHLPTVRRLYPELARRAEADGMTYQTFLELLIAEEIAHRAETRMRRAVRAARFPFVRTIDDFSFTFQASLRRQMLGTYLGLELVPEGRNAIFSGPSGTGKTHLAIAIAYRALQHGDEARFVAADLLIGELSHAVQLGTLDAAIAPYLHPHVLVLDEIGDLSHAADAAN
ncbi:MAG: IS21 family transposase, partial [Gemmatimonadaceae bacterium]|nr:IS21 family transposase [Gemmatimonadaceae bacterium]